MHPSMQHPIALMVMDLLEADLRRDRVRTEEIHRALAARGWRVTIERVDPPKPVREPHVPEPVPLGDMSPAETLAYLQRRPQGRQRPGSC